MKQTNYKTKDQFLASTLYAIGQKLEGVKNEDGVIYFVFEDEEKCESIVKKYYGGDLEEDPRKLWEGFRQIKSLIFSNK